MLKYLNEYFAILRIIDCQYFFIFYSSLFENRNKVNEILKIGNISAVKMVLEKTVSVGIISSVMCILCFAVNKILFKCSGYILPLTIILLFI